MAVSSAGETIAREAHALAVFGFRPHATGQRSVVHGPCRAATAPTAELIMRVNSPNLLIVWGDEIGRPSRQSSASFSLSKEVGKLQEGGD